jgi:hypothetical protein
MTASSIVRLSISVCGPSMRFHPNQLHMMQAHHRSAQAASYRHGERALQALVLPAGVVDTNQATLGGMPAGCPPAPPTRCLHTTVMVNDVHPLLDQLVAGGHDVCVVQTDPCAVYGRI